MAKQVKQINLVQGKTVVPVSTKTTSNRYIKKLIDDYRRLGVFKSGEVEIVPVVPLFS